MNVSVLALLESVSAARDVSQQQVAGTNTQCDRPNSPKA